MSSSTAVPSERRSILAFPAAYRLFSRLIGGDYRSVFVNTYLRPRTGDRILDIGCGTGEILAHLPPVSYLGLDISPRYIAAATVRFGDRATFRCIRAGEARVEESGSYDLVMADGVVHHLDDGEARALFRLARAALKPGGRLVTKDGCFEKGQPAVARFLLSRDRGRFVRDRAGYLALATEMFPHVEAVLRNDLLRLPYTHLILECSH